jgi:methionyl-tRNA formyltransferase
VTYAAKIDKAEARIDWSRPADAVDRQIRGLAPFPGAWCEVAGERVKLLGSEPAEGEGAPGQVLGGFTVACGTGAVRVTRAQRPGRGAMAADEILRGLTLPPVLD